MNAPRDPAVSRVIVIGAGVAGLTAALRLARAGVNVTLLNKGIGGLQLSQGTVDVLGYSPTDPKTRVANPLAAVAELSDADPKHPYHAIGVDAVRAGVTFLQDELGDQLLAGEVGANHLLPTAVGAIRPTCLAQPSMLAGACVAGARFAIVGLRRLKDFHAELIAGNLSRTVLPDGGSLGARSLIVDLPARAREVDSSGLSYARAFDDPEFRAAFAAELGPQLRPGETVGLPAVLGLKDLSAWQDLAERLGHPVFEIPLPPPSVPGMRLNGALTAAARAAGVRIVNGSFVGSPVSADGRLLSVSIEAAGAPRAFTGDAFVLATGGFESGALTLDSYGQVTERVLNLPLAGPTGSPLSHGDHHSSLRSSSPSTGSGVRASSHTALLNRDWAAEQPLFSVGVAVDSSMRVVAPDDSPVPSNVWAAGGLLAGAVRWREKSGEGIAVGSAVKAADAIVKELA